jgi:formate dehydrogenase subunit delta
MEITVDNRDIIRMANQIGGFFKSYGIEEGKKEVAAHINNFWEPRMRAQFFDYLGEGGKELDPIVIEASKLIRKPENHEPNQLHLPKHGEES